MDNMCNMEKEDDEEKGNKEKDGRFIKGHWVKDIGAQR